jgi:hypothetical protein
MIKITLQDLYEELEARNTVHELDKLLTIANNLPLSYNDGLTLLHAIVAKKKQIARGNTA